VIAFDLGTIFINFLLTQFILVNRELNKYVSLTIAVASGLICLPLAFKSQRFGLTLSGLYCAISFIKLTNYLLRSLDFLKEDAETIWIIFKIIIIAQGYAYGQSALVDFT
jgi:hypothetical protein